MCNSLETFEGDRHIHPGEFQNLPGNGLGVIADSLQFEVDADGGVGETEQSRNWLLTDQKFQTEPVQLLFQLVNSLIAEDNRISQGPVALQQRLETIPQSLFTLAGHFTDLGPNPVKVALQRCFVVSGHIEYGEVEGQA